MIIHLFLLLHDQFQIVYCCKVGGRPGLRPCPFLSCSCWGALPAVIAPAKWTDEHRRRCFLLKKTQLKKTHGSLAFWHDFSKELTKVEKALHLKASINVPQNSSCKVLSVESTPAQLPRREEQALLTFHFWSLWLLSFFSPTLKSLATSSPPGDISPPRCWNALGTHVGQWFL